MNYTITNTVGSGLLVLLLFALSISSEAVINGTAVTVSGTTTCNNGVTERVVAGTMTTTCGDGWSVGGLESPAQPLSTNILLNYNSGSGQSLTDWTWSDNANGFNQPGWYLNKNVNGPFGGGYDLQSIVAPVMFNKTTSGQPGEIGSGTIDINERAPSTVSGGSLHVFAPPGTVDNRPTWWTWYDGRPLSEIGVTDATTDRMSFYMKTEGVAPIDPANVLEHTANVGTYLCWNEEGVPGGCPEEGPGNQHYYHWFLMNSGGWVHVLLDQMPQHLRGRTNGGPMVLNNPVKLSDGKNYFEQLFRFYIETSYVQAGDNSMWLDEIEFYSTSTTEEPLQNDISVSSITVGYFPATSHWEISFMDNSFQTYGNETFSTFEVRWSLSPITNANWSSATPVNLQYFTGTQYTGQATANVFRRHNSWKRSAWNKFTIDPNLLSGSTIYFAVKDVSVLDGNIGTLYPYSFSGDARGPASEYVKTISYPLGGIL